MANSISAARKQVYPAHQAAAYVLGVVTILLPPMFYWQYGPMLFGMHPLVKLFLLSGIGGAVSFALYAGRRRYLAGGGSGLIGGLGAAGLHLLYTTALHKQTMLTTESGLMVLLGAAPGMTLLALILHRDQGRQTLPAPAGAPAGKSS